MLASKIFNAEVLVPGQNLSLPLGSGICSSIIPTENVDISRIAGECEGYALDTSEKKESHGYLKKFMSEMGIRRVL